MCPKKIVLSLITVTALLFVLKTTEANADFYHQTFNFDKKNLKFEKVSGYDCVSITQDKNYDFCQEVGNPRLPIRVVRLYLPLGKEISEIQILSTESEYLEGEYNIYPTQPPRVLSLPDDEIEFVQPKEDVYSLSKLYPEKVVNIAKQGYFAGYNIGSILVYPLQYLPAEKKLVFHSKIKIEISYKDSKEEPLPFSKRTDYSETILGDMIKKIVKNSDDVQNFLPRRSAKNSKLPDEEHLYVIITRDDFVPSFQALADWKLKKGLSATIVTTSWIYSEYSGIDEPEQIRNFIKDAYQNWGTLWVLLGFDVHDITYNTWTIPCRYAFAMDCEAGLEPNENKIPCDLYFADLEGDWNANGNDVFGEIADSIDMYPDIIVGRASVKNASEATIFANKILTYEKNPPMDYQLNMLFLAMILWWDPYTDSGIGKDFIDDAYIVDTFDPITKLYESLGNENYETSMAALNAGQNIINHSGHAWKKQINVGEGALINEDMDILTNGPAYSILYSIGCWPAAFDYNCFAEHFILNPNGGGVAFIGNSRYGWGSPGNPTYGYSDKFDQQFFHNLFDNNIYQIGSTLAAAKSSFVPLSSEENVYRWCEYEINLLGDPEMPIWTNIPNDLFVTYPEELPLGNSYCPIFITAEGEPVEGALVCLMQHEDVYETDITGIDGKVNFEISTSNPSNEIQLTVTAQNYIPFEATISLIANEPYIQISSYQTNESEEGYIIPGDLVLMDVCFANFGDETAYDLSAFLATENINITMIDSVESIEIIPACDHIFIENAFSFQVSSAIENGDVIYLNSEISDTNNTWSDLITVTGTTPVISYFHYDIIDNQYGDGDGFAEPGEIPVLYITLKNEGLSLGENVNAVISCDNPYIEIPGNIWEFGDILPSESGQTFVEIVIDIDCPAPSFPQINIDILTENGYAYSDSFLISIGEIGFQDDMEFGSDCWTHSGTYDLWHLTSNRKFSGDYSWYCGNEGEFVYDDNAEEILVSIPFTVGQNAELSFWCWCEFPNYGTDGLYVEINDGTGWTDLDFIGSGGALGILTIVNEWCEYKYDLSGYSPETELSLRFRFTSSTIIDGGEVAEGVYIDDVLIQNNCEIATEAVYGDVNGDGDVTSYDAALTLQYSAGLISDWEYWQLITGDVNGDTNISSYDAALILQYSAEIIDEFPVEGR